MLNSKVKPMIKLNGNRNRCIALFCFLGALLIDNKEGFFREIDLLRIDYIWWMASSIYTSCLLGFVDRCFLPRHCRMSLTNLEVNISFSRCCALSFFYKDEILALTFENHLMVFHSSTYLCSMRRIIFLLLILNISKQKRERERERDKTTKIFKKKRERLIPLKEKKTKERERENTNLQIFQYMHMCVSDLLAE